MKPFYIQGYRAFLGAAIFLLSENSDPRWFFVSFSLCGAGFALLFGIIMSQGFHHLASVLGQLILGILQLSLHLSISGLWDG